MKWRSLSGVLFGSFLIASCQNPPNQTKLDIVFDTDCPIEMQGVNAKYKWDTVRQRLQQGLDSIDKSALTQVQKDCMRNKLTGKIKIYCYCEPEDQKKGYTRIITGTIFVNVGNQEGPTDMARTIIHEFAHKCGFHDHDGQSEAVRRQDPTDPYWVEEQLLPL